MLSLKCDIEIKCKDSKKTIKFDYCNDILIKASCKNHTDTAVLKVPRMQEEANVSEDEQHEKVATYMKTKDWQNAIAQHWNINRAKQGIVFDANQMYIRKFPDNLHTILPRISTPKVWKAIPPKQVKFLPTWQAISIEPERKWNLTL